MERKIRKNYLYNLIYQITAIIYPLLITPYVSRIFQADGVGQYAVTVTIVTYFTLIFVCVGKYGFREISLESDKQKKSNVFFELLFIKFIICFVLIPIYFFSFCNNGDLSELYSVQIISFLNGVLDVSWFLQGNEKFKQTAIVNIIMKITTILFVFLFIKEKKDLFLYAGIVSIGVFLGSISMWFMLKGELIKPNSFKPYKHFLPCFLISLPFFITELYSSFDKTMIKFITNNDYEVGYYEETLKIARLVMVVITSMSVVKAPNNTRLFKESNISELKKTNNESINFILFLSLPICFGVMAVANNFVPVFFGQGYDKVVNLLYLYSAFIVIHSFVDFLSIQILIPGLMQNFYTLALIISSIINITLNFLLIPSLYSIGSVIATICSESILVIILIIKCKKYIDWHNIFINNYKKLIASLIMFCLCYFSFVFSSWNNLTILILKIILGFLSYFLILLILKDSTIQKYIKKRNK